MRAMQWVQAVGVISGCNHSKDSKALIHPTEFLFLFSQTASLSVNVFGNMNEASPLPEELYSSEKSVFFRRNVHFLQLLLTWLFSIHAD